MSWALYLLSTLFRSLRIIFRVDIQDKTKTDGKKNKVSVKEYALKCADILSLSAFYYYLIFADSPLTLLKEGDFNKSNIIIGVTKDDGTVFANGFSGWTELTWF